MSKQEITVIGVEKLVKGDPENYIPDHIETRYVIVDKLDRSKVLDDGQGYGYKSAQAAYKAWGWKHRSNDAILKETFTKKWIKKNQEICDNIANDNFYKLKDEGENFKPIPLKQHLKHYGVSNDIIDKLNLRYLSSHLS